MANAAVRFVPKHPSSWAPIHAIPSHFFASTVLPAFVHWHPGKNGKCRITYFQMTDNEEQGKLEDCKLYFRRKDCAHELSHHSYTVFTITRDFQLEISNVRTKAQAKAQDALKECRSMEIDANGKMGTSPVDKMDKMAECMKETLGDRIYATQEEIDFQVDVRRRLGSKLTTYACSDPAFPQTEPIFTKEWDPSKARIVVADDRNHDVKVLLQADTTMIALIGNISKSSDCESMQQFAMMNEADRSLVPWEARKDMATISLLSRIFAYADPAVKLMNLYAGLPEKGQNLFKVFHDSSKFPQHEEQRVLSDDVWPVDSSVYARLLMFCEVPEENSGGAVHFPESGIHIKPALEEALLITYTKPLASQGMNEQFKNEHIFCPILDGNRTFIQHQFRLFPNNKD